MSTWQLWRDAVKASGFTCPSDYATLSVRITEALAATPSTAVEAFEHQRLSRIVESIDIDLPRTGFPSFDEEQQQRLKSLLLAYLALHNGMGYDQTMTKIGAALVATAETGCEEEVFDVFCCVFDHYSLADLISPRSKLLPLYTRACQRLIQSKFPSLHKHFIEVKFYDFQLYKWLVTLFLDLFHFADVQELWLALLAGGREGPGGLMNLLRMTIIVISVLRGFLVHLDQESMQAFLRNICSEDSKKMSKVLCRLVLDNFQKVEVPMQAFEDDSDGFLPLGLLCLAAAVAGTGCWFALHHPSILTESSVNLLLALPAEEARSLGNEDGEVHTLRPYDSHFNSSSSSKLLTLQAIGSGSELSSLATTRLRSDEQAEGELQAPSTRNLPPCGLSGLPSTQRPVADVRHLAGALPAFESMDAAAAKPSGHHFVGAFGTRLALPFHELGEDLWSIFATQSGVQSTVPNSPSGSE